VRQLWFPALVMLVAVGFPVAARAETWQEQSTHDVPAAGIRSLEVENARGLVSVKRANRPWIHLEALKIVRSNDSHWARRVSRETQVVAENHGGEYTVHVVYPQRQTVRIMFWDLLSGFELPRVEVRLALEVPDGIALTLRTTSGDLTSTDVRSPQLLESTSGDVSVSGASSVRVVCTSGDVSLFDTGAAQIRSVSGDLVAERSRGPLSAETTSGDVRVRRAADSLEASTESGDIEVDAAPKGVHAGTTSGGIDVRRASGRIRLESASGDIGLGLSAPLERADVSTSSGDVEVKLPRTLGCALDLGSSNGDIHAEVPLSVENVTRHKLTGIVRRGTAPLVVRTASGDINVSEAAP